MLDIFTTIAHHPNGIDLHLRNLKWAFNDIPFRIHVFTYDWFDFSYPDINFFKSSYYDNPNNRHFNFHENLLPAIIKDIKTDAVLLMQQDILFIEKANNSFYECINEGKIITQGMTNYFSVFNKDGLEKYPRLWEGATFYPISLLKEAVKNGINLGNNFNRFNDNEFKKQHQEKLRNYFHKLPNNNLISIYDLIESNIKPKSEKLYELTLYSFCQQKEYKVNSQTIHLQGIEKVHRVCPEVYSKPNKLFSNPKIANKYINNCLFAYRICNVYENNSFIQNDYSMQKLNNDLLKLKKYAHQWMTKKEQTIVEDFIKRKITML